MQVGDLVKCVDGVIVPNFAVLLLGENTVRLCDAGLKRWMKVVGENGTKQ
jgi:hypothetical protein